MLFSSTRDGGGVFWKAADGTGQVERLMKGPARPYAWTADGRLIFEQDRDIGVLTMEGERTVEMLLDTEDLEGEPALSRDGRWLAYFRIGNAGPTRDLRPGRSVSVLAVSASLRYAVIGRRRIDHGRRTATCADHRLTTCAVALH